MPLTSSRFVSSTSSSTRFPVAACISSSPRGKANISVDVQRVEKMTPPCHSFAASELPLKTQQDARGRRRKLDGGAPLDLSACQLLQMLQYKCELPVRDGPVQCFAVQRLFRK